MARTHDIALMLAAVFFAASPTLAQSPETRYGSAGGVESQFAYESPTPTEGPTVPVGPASFAPPALPPATPADAVTQFPAAPAAAPQYPVPQSATPQSPTLPGIAPTAEAPSPVSTAQPFQGGQIVARIAGEVVLAAEVSEGIDEILEANKDRIPPGEMEKARLALMKRNLDQLIDTKLLYADARRSIPKENFAKVEEQIDKQFEKERVPQLFKLTKTETRAELEVKLHTLGSSLAQQRRAFGERLLAQQWLRQHVSFDDEITHDQMLAYYQEHAAEFEFEAQARWEELAVRFDRFPSKAEAYRALAEMGNEVWRGAQLADVAKAKSQGVTADEGGQYDWTTRGSLVSQAMNRALFTLPVGQLSPIIETDHSFHIIRVLERHDAGRTPFVEAQVEIKKKIRDERTKNQMDEYLQSVRAQARIWSIFDDMPELSQRK